MSKNKKFKVALLVSIIALFNYLYYATWLDTILSIKFIEYLLCFNLFDFLYKYHWLLQVMFDLILFGSIFLYFFIHKKSLYKICYKYINTIRLIEPTFHIYLLSAIFITPVIGLIINHNLFLKIIWNGDYIVFIYVLFIINCCMGFRQKLNERKDMIHKLEKVNHEYKSENILPKDPINYFNQDLLQYGVLAMDITLLTFNNKPNDKLYSLGIIGEWGSGKTSLMNLVRLRLRTEKYIENNNEAKCYEIIDFNVAEYENINEIHLHFFYVLLNKINEECFVPMFDKNNLILNLTEKIGKGISFLNLLNFLSLNIDFSGYVKKLSEWIYSLGKVFVVFVDDVDRLTKTEMDSFLKLLRITEHTLKGVVIIVASDDEFIKTYFDKVLKLEK